MVDAQFLIARNKKVPRLSGWFTRLAMEPPFRIVARALAKVLPVSITTRDFWEASERPNYLMGLLAGAAVARKQGHTAMTAIEFGVAGGNGLVVMEREAVAVEKATGVRVHVVGFDNGPIGLPSFIGDFRDHPDVWQPGDYPMDISALKARLHPSTRLVIGPVVETVPIFVAEMQESPLGFVAFDLDLYSSTKDALSIFQHSSRQMLKQVPLYFDDIEPVISHRFAGELLAIDEFNTENEHIKIDQWYQAECGRPFPERTYFRKMFIAHDLAAISSFSLNRTRRHLALQA